MTLEAKPTNFSDIPWTKKICLKLDEQTRIELITNEQVFIGQKVFYENSYYVINQDWMLSLSINQSGGVFHSDPN